MEFHLAVTHMREKADQIKELIIMFQIPQQMNNSFKNILEKNAIEDLDIENKDISINSGDIEYSVTGCNHHRFQTPIFDHRKAKIGYFALVVTHENERIDEYFVIA